MFQSLCSIAKLLNVYHKLDMMLLGPCMFHSCAAKDVMFMVGDNVFTALFTVDVAVRIVVLRLRLVCPGFPSAQMLFLAESLWK